MYIGELAERARLSLRTVRFYEEAGLLAPVGRTIRGFRLYDEDAVDRLDMVKSVKPLGFTLEEIREILTLRDAARGHGLVEGQQEDLQEQLRKWSERAQEKIAKMREKMNVAESFVCWLREQGEPV
ncbi:MerR family transcriptional regulator [Parafrankia elaeagni]|uniref:MerR family transcriptional regulator n=1 Tax=Parafrankia elaeagni TaxID=222534 RepID=UPI00037396A3|nr:MerR family transcriptional regulator [Parafrankia elaeagni]